MLRLVSSQAALEADRWAETEFGYPTRMLMEEAGIRLQDRLEFLLEREKLSQGTVAYLSGSGNNGGDALVMARQAFLRGRSVVVIEVFPPSSESCVWEAALIRHLNIPVFRWPDAEARAALRRASVWVDGVWGTGLKGALRADRGALIRELENFRAENAKSGVAVDVPSGLWEGWTAGEPVLQARWTLSPGWLKEFCFYPETRHAVGLPAEVPLAFPRPASSSVHLVLDSDLGALLPSMDAAAYKGTRGHVAVVGGAPGMSGALVLAARSAAAAGAGLVSLGIDPGLNALVIPQVPAFQVRSADDLVARTDRYDCVVVGPGWGRGDDRVGLLETLWSTELPLVLDADGLSAWAKGAFGPRPGPVVLTPHPGEFRRLGAGDAPTVAAARSLARNRGVVVVLKGAVTWVVGPDGRGAVWDGANPALGTGGSGDCLAGVVGALLARGLGAFDAAAAAVALHGSAGRALASQGGWFTADRLPESIALLSYSRNLSACAASLGPL